MLSEEDCLERALVSYRVFCYNAENMGIENFRDRYNFPDLREQVLKEKERFPKISAPAYLAWRFAEFGAEELRSEEVKIKKKARLYHQQNNNEIYHILPFDQEKVSVAYATIGFGLSLKYTEAAFEVGVFDKPGFVNEHNEKIKDNILYRPLYSEPWDAQVLGDDQWTGLMRLGESDRTLSILFEEGYLLMPHFIQEFIGNQDNLFRIRRWILPIYRPLAQRVAA